MRRIILALMLLAGTSNASQWITGYYPTWFYGGGMASAMDFSLYTHIIIFPAQDALSTAPYFNPSYVLSYTEFTTTITRSHAVGTKVLFSIVGGWGNSTNLLAASSNDAKCKLLVDSTEAFLLRYHLDGIDIDWEFPYSGDKPAYNRLIRMFRQRLDTWNPKGVMTGAFYYSTSGGSYDWDSVYAAFDQVNLMTYTMWQGTSSNYIAGFDTPVDMPTSAFPSYSGVALNSATGGPRSYPANKRTKIGIGYTYEASHFTGTTGFGTAYGNFSFDYPSNVPSSTRTWNSQAQAYYCVNGTDVWSYPDTNSAKAVAKLTVDSSYGGIMLYNICEGYNSYFTPIDALSRSVKSIVGGTGTYTPPVTQTHYLRRKK